MEAVKVNYFSIADKAIQSMNKANLEAFGKMKLADWDKVNIIQTIMTVYRKSAKQARKKYFEIAFEVYVIGAMMCGKDSKEAHRMAQKNVTLRWIDQILTQTDFVTLYRFDSEADRKAYKLAEILEVSRDRDFEINKALRYWSQQLSQYALNVTDYAMVGAFTDCGVEFVEWISEHDNRTCNECYALNGQIFRIDEIPAKPHWGCRCRMRPVFRDSDGYQGNA